MDGWMDGWMAWLGWLRISIIVEDMTLSTVHNLKYIHDMIMPPFISSLRSSNADNTVSGIIVSRLRS